MREEYLIVVFYADQKLLMTCFYEKLLTVGLSIADWYARYYATFYFTDKIQYLLEK
jgi:hypothetical protein